MSSIYTLIPIAMLFLGIAVALFFWAIKSNQFDDLDREGINILFEEDPYKIDPQENKNTDPQDAHVKQ